MSRRFWLGLARALVSSAGLAAAVACGPAGDVEEILFDPCSAQLFLN